MKKTLSSFEFNATLFQDRIVREFIFVVLICIGLLGVMETYELSVCIKLGTPGYPENLLTMSDLAL